MKKLLIGLLVLTSVSAFAERKCADIGFRVCADITKSGKNVALTSITPDIQKKNSIARELCSLAGDPLTDYKIQIVTGKSCNYYATKGFHAGGMVSACLDLGGFSRGKVFSKIKCMAKN